MTMIYSLYKIKSQENWLRYVLIIHISETLDTHIHASIPLKDAVSQLDSPLSSVDRNLMATLDALNITVSIWRIKNGIISSVGLKIYHYWYTHLTSFLPISLISYLCVQHCDYTCMQNLVTNSKLVFSDPGSNTSVRKRLYLTLNSRSLLRPVQYDSERKIYFATLASSTSWPESSLQYQHPKQVIKRNSSFVSIYLCFNRVHNVTMYGRMC